MAAPFFLLIERVLRMEPIKEVQKFEVDDRAIVTSKEFFGAIVIVRKVDKETGLITVAMPWCYEREFKPENLAKVIKGISSPPPELRITTLHKMIVDSDFYGLAKILCLMHKDCDLCPMKKYNKGECVIKGWVGWLKEVRTVDDDITRGLEFSEYRRKYTINHPTDETTES